MTGPVSASRWMLMFALISACGDSTGSGPSTTSIRVSSAPTAIDAGQTFSVTVELIGPDGAVASHASGNVSLVVENPAIDIQGITTVAARDGIATFAGLSITKSGTDLQFVATRGELVAASGLFAVRAGPFVASQTTLSPAAGNVPPNADTELTFVFRDEFGNPAPDVPVTVASDLVGATFAPASGATTIDGEFVTLFRPNSTGSAVVTVTGDGTPIAVTGSYASVDLCPAPVLLTIPGTTTGTQPCGAYTSSSVAPSWYSFAAPGGGISFTLAATFAAEFGILTQIGASGVVFATDAAHATAEWLLPPALPSGQFFLGVRTLSGPGTFELSGSLTAGNSPGVQRTLVVHGAYPGQALTAGDSPGPGGGFMDTYLFLSHDPCRIRLSAGFLTRLSVADAVTGASLAPDRTAGGPFPPPITDLIACRGGEANPVRISVSSVNAGGTGSYILTVEPLPAPPERRASRLIEQTKPLRRAR